MENPSPAPIRYNEPPSGHITNVIEIIKEHRPPDSTWNEELEGDATQPNKKRAKTNHVIYDEEELKIHLISGKGTWQQGRRTLLKSNKKFIKSVKKKKDKVK